MYCNHILFTDNMHYQEIAKTALFLFYDRSLFLRIFVEQLGVCDTTKKIHECCHLFKFRSDKVSFSVEPMRTILIWSFAPFPLQSVPIKIGCFEDPMNMRGSIVSCLDYSNSNKEFAECRSADSQVCKWFLFTKMTKF